MNPNTINRIIHRREQKFSNCSQRCDQTLSRIFEIELNLSRLDSELKVLIAQSIIQNLNYDSINDIHKTEMKVFSQWGEDGIIQWLIQRVPIKNPVFVEFGVENYRESNTRFLLIANNWKGLVIDSSENNIKEIKSSEIYWKFQLQAIASFVTRDNINSILEGEGIVGDIGLLSIDIDGNDYWVWEAISVISPRIVICEYNSIFGAEKAISIPYNQNFQRTQAHYSNLYYGASLPALCRLVEQKGYVFVGSNSAGNNAFFVRKDLSSGLPSLSASEGYVMSLYRESRDEDGNLSYISGEKRLQVISDMPVVNVIDNSISVLSDIFFEN